MIIELVSQTSPGSAHIAEDVTSLEARISPRQEDLFADTKSNGILQSVSVNRASSNISTIEYVSTVIRLVMAVSTVIRQ